MTGEKKKKKKKQNKAESLEQHKAQKVGQVCCATSIIHCLGGARVIEDPDDDAQHLKRGEVERPGWRVHWQFDTPEQVMENKPWNIKANAKELKRVASRPLDLCTET